MDEIIISSIKGVLDEYSTIINTLLFFIYIAGAWYCVYRAGTFNFIIHRIWWIYSGASNFSNQKMKSAWEDVIDVETFRFKLGLRVNSPKQAENILKWLALKNINTYDVISISKFFDVEKLEIKKVNFKLRSYFWLLSLLVFALLMVLTNWYYIENKFSDVARYTIIKSGTNFKFDGEKAFIYSYSLNKEWCNKDDGVVLDYKLKQDIKVVCEYLLSDNKERYKSTVDSQRNLFVSLVILLIIMQFISFVHSYKYFNAYGFVKMHGDKINKKFNKRKDHLVRFSKYYEKKINKINIRRFSK